MDNRGIIALRSFIIAVGATTASTFVGVYGVLIGASAADMGWLQSGSNALTNGGQILWGRLSDRIGRRLPFLLFGSVAMAAAWFAMGAVRTPDQLIVIYSILSLIAAMITVNWFSLIADTEASSTRGRFLALINNLSSIGTIVSLLIMSFLFQSSSRKDILIPFYAAAASYLISAVFLLRFKEAGKATKVTGNIRNTLSHLKDHDHFYKYFVATNMQGLFWSMAWPVFPITMVSIMHFTLSNVAVLSASSLVAMIVAQYAIGRVVDRVNRPPLILSNRMMLSLIPLFYAIFGTFTEFILLEVYSGIIGALQNVVMNSYVMDIVPEGNKAEYISILNGFNGIVYFLGALAGGYILQGLIDIYGLREGLTFIYLIIVGGRFGTSLLFARIKETEKRSKDQVPLFSILFRLRDPGSPSGGVLKPK